MMRELKEGALSGNDGKGKRCSPNPYDEGTERLPHCYRAIGTDYAAAQIPMMRELKETKTKEIPNKSVKLQPKSL